MSCSRQGIAGSRSLGLDAGGYVPLALRFDYPASECHRIAVKVAKTTAGKRTPGTVAVAKHRRLMNRLTTAERRKLRQRAAELLS